MTTPYISMTSMALKAQSNKEIRMNNACTNEANPDAHACRGGCSEDDDLVGEPTNYRPVPSFLNELVWMALWTLVLGSLRCA